jgi:hypothetical protein
MKMISGKLKWLLILGLAFGLGVAWAQGQSTAPPSDTEQQVSKPDTENPGDSGAVADPDSEPPAEPVAGVIDEIPEVPKEIQEAIDNQDQVHATMERFEPTEKLSEDRAVAFPNDI